MDPSAVVTDTARQTTNLILSIVGKKKIKLYCTVLYYTIQPLWLFFGFCPPHLRGDGLYYTFPVISKPIDPATVVTNTASQSTDLILPT